MRTNVGHIYAIGDVNGLLCWRRRGTRRGSRNHCRCRDLTLGDHRCCRATFCQPNAASFGLTEQQARKRRRDVVVAVLFTANAKAPAGDPSGFVAGGHAATASYCGYLVGHDVAEPLPELTLRRGGDPTASELARNVHTHPTMSEALQECFHGLVGHMINFLSGS